MEGNAVNDVNSNEVRDQLPSDLDVSAFVGPYQFPITAVVAFLVTCILELLR
jgi:hypothetical protein